MSAKVVIGFGGGKSYAFTVTATGRDKARFTRHFTTDAHKLLGGLEQNDYGFVLRTPSLTK